MRCHRSRIGGGEGGCTPGSDALSGTMMTGTTGSEATAGAEETELLEEEVFAGGEEGDTAGGGEGEVRIGLGVRNSPPLVAQPASQQQMPSANQKVADLFESRMLKNLQGSRQCR